MLALAVGLVAIHLPGLTISPPINHDEIMLNAAARSWTSRGIVALTPLAGVGNTYARAYYWHPPGHLLAMAVAYRLFGFSVGVTRGESLAGGAVVLMLFFAVLRRLGIGRSLAGAVAALLAAHPLFWWLCRSGRMDFEAMSFGLAAMLTMLPADGRNVIVRRACLAGALVGCGGLFHVMVLVWAPAIVLADAARQGRVNWKNAFALGALAALPLAAWVLVAFARGEGPAWSEQFLGYQVGKRSGHGPVWARPFEEIGLFARHFAWFPAMIAMLAVGLTWGWKESPSSRRWAAGGAAGAWLLIAFGTAKGTGAYPLYWFVWFLFVAAFGLASLAPRVKTWLVAFALANVALVQFSMVAVALHQRKARDGTRVDAFFAKYIKPGSVVLGPEDIWYALENAGAELRIWENPDPTRQNYCVTYANIPLVPPPGFKLLAELPDTMPKVLGRYWSSCSYSYRIWIPDR